MSSARTFALVPAAGKSSRMGRPKLLLPLGGRSVLAHVVEALRQGGLETILVVTAPGASDLARQAEAAGTQILTLAEDTIDMRATVEHGLAWLEERCHPGPEDGWLLSPADHPMLEGAVIRRLVEARAAHPERSIFIPTYQGSRGHPALLAWSHVAAIRRLPAGQGLNAYLRSQAVQTLPVPVESPAILCDLDTPEDYARLLARNG
jgi:molybdenum cofactor cytidylyltransferase